MITREEALRRLKAVANELAMITREGRLEAVVNKIAALQAELAEGWVETPVEDATAAFLAKCGDWEDTRSPEVIIADIYATRTVSDRGADIFSQNNA